MFKGIDLSSDTVTLPTEPMLQAMIHPPWGLGDDQRGEDPTTQALQTKVAELLGLEDAVFLPTATLANEIAILLHCQRGEEVIAAENSHIFVAEAGGPAFHAGVQARAVETPTGIFGAADIEKKMTRLQGPHFPISKLVVVENTTNMGGGIAWPLQTLNEVTSAAKSLGLKTHLDGSRLFNAATKLNVKPNQITSQFDSVTVCLSKGLGCPTGAVLAYSKKYFPVVRRLKQLMGGAMRQNGILAAAGIYALDHHLERLREDHHHASLLAKRMADELPELKIENKEPETNMVFFRLGDPARSHQFLEKCVGNGLRFSLVGENRFRAVTHLNIAEADIARSLSILKDVFTSLK
jgi:threonine aldolase